MSDDETITVTQDLQKAIDAAVAAYMDELKDDIHTMRRAIVGAPEEGNQGILKRMNRTEKRVAIMIWLMPVWITAGTGLGQILIQVWNL